MALVNDIVTRLYLNGDWRDISTHVRAEQGISYQRGRRGQDDTTPPASCTLTLDNGAAKGNGNYTEQNPMGQWYGYLGRFTPAEVKLRHVRDTATTTASNGWGSTDTHSQGAWNVEAWTISGTAADFSKSSGRMNVAVTAAGQTKIGYLASYRGRDVGVSVTWSSTLTNVTGPTLGAGVCPANILVRGQGALTSYYMLRMVIQTDETITLDWWDATNTSITGSAVSSGVTYVAGATYRTRVEVEGRTLRSKVWNAANPEPFEWTDSFTDEGDTATSGPTVEAQGWVGIRTSHTGTNTNGSTTYSYDDFEVYSFIAAGEVSEWPQSRDVTGRDQTVPITIQGPRGRLVTSRTIARSALYQKFMVATFYSGYVPIPHAYFPLEDSPQTSVESVLEATGGSSQLKFVPSNSSSTVSQVKWASETSRPGSKQSVTLSGGANLVATLSPPTPETLWGVTWQHKPNFADGAFVVLGTLSAPNLPIYLLFTIGAGLTILNIALDGGGASVPAMIQHDFGSKEEVEKWHTIHFEAQQLGSDVAFFLYVDGEFSDSHTQAGFTLRGLQTVQLSALPNTNGETGFGHLAVWGANLLSGVSAESNSAAALGNVGESPVYRAKRVAEEYGYGLDWIGFGGTTGYNGEGDGKPMGAQRVTDILNLLNDAEKVDGGLLYEQRSSSRFQFRTLGSMSSRSPWVSLDMGTSKHLSPPLVPVSDPRNIVNRFTASRADGGEYVYSLDSGPMSTLAPHEGGIGTIDRGDTYNVQSDRSLPDIATRRVARGTIAQERYPSVTVELHRPAVYNTAGLAAKLRDLDVGDQIALTGMESNDIYGDRDELVIGIGGKLDQYRHTLVLTTEPAELLRIWTPGSTTSAASEFARVDSDYTTLDEDLTLTETDVTIEVEANRAFWVNSVSHPNNFPFDVMCGGERWTVTAGTAPSGQNQTWTVTRSVNGVQKTHSAGAKVTLAEPNYLGL